MQTLIDREIEVKLYILHPEQLAKKLEKEEARLVQPRVNEWNLRFDSLNNGLSSTGKVLRLRKDTRSRLTYKSEASLNDDVTDRQELEVEVSDFDMTRKILEAIGFSVFVMYEKYRTTWQWLECEVTLDEMPYGYFCEIEGHDTGKIRNVVDRLGLDWNQRILTSYLGLFTMLKNIGKVKAENLIFSAFENENVTRGDFELLNIHPSDFLQSP